MAEELRKQIHANLNQKDSKKLIEIWQKNNRYEWSDPVFEIFQQLLQERLGNLPPQNEPVYVGIGDEEERSGSDTPVFYRPNNIVRLEIWLDRAAIVAVIATFISNLYYLKTIQNVMQLFYWSNFNRNAIAWGFAIIIYFFFAGLERIVFYFSLKGLGAVLKY